MRNQENQSQTYRNSLINPERPRNTQAEDCPITDEPQAPLVADGSGLFLLTHPGQGKWTFLSNYAQEYGDNNSNGVSGAATKSVLFSYNKLTRLVVSTKAQR